VSRSSRRCRLRSIKSRSTGHIRSTASGTSWPSCCRIRRSCFALSLTKSTENEIYRKLQTVFHRRLQARAGDFASALKTADIITRPDYKIDALLAIGDAQLDARDLAGARRTLALVGQLAELRKGTIPTLS